MNIILFGYRGSGKSAIGQAIANKLLRPFVDVDDAIRARYDHLTIAEIWKQFGEPHFRQTEHEVTLDLLQQDGNVIALAGGTLTHPGTLSAIQSQSNAKRFFLTASPEVLHARIHGDVASQTERPALTQQGGNLEEIQAVLAERLPAYTAAADHIVDVSRNTIDQLADQVIGLLND
ncbi:shikimate kinase [Poriferisphaera sp. WC338]|uniref:shikimate kinase n=1 Tax=Poriferisphaera sp. WC338 TaxID=3425129 RepID=UPI003D81C36C